MALSNSASLGISRIPTSPMDKTMWAIDAQANIAIPPRRPARTIRRVISSLLCFGRRFQALRQAEPVTGIVLEQRLDAIKALLWGLFEFHSARLQLLIGLVDVSGFQHTAPDRTFPAQLAQHVGRFLVHHGA